MLEISKFVKKNPLNLHYSKYEQFKIKFVDAVFCFFLSDEDDVEEVVDDDFARYSSNSFANRSAPSLISDISFFFPP